MFDLHKLYFGRLILKALQMDLPIPVREQLARLKAVVSLHGLLSCVVVVPDPQVGA